MNEFFRKKRFSGDRDRIRLLGVLNVTGVEARAGGLSADARVRAAEAAGANCRSAISAVICALWRVTVVLAPDLDGSAPPIPRGSAVPMAMATAIATRPEPGRTMGADAMAQDYRGKRMRMRVPRPCSGAPMVKLASCARAISSTIASPSPQPLPGVPGRR